MKKTVNSLLNKDSSARPTARDVLKLPLFNQREEELKKRIWDLSSGTRKVRESTSSASVDMMPVVTTKSSEVYFWGGGKFTPQKLETFQKARGAIQVRSLARCEQLNWPSTNPIDCSRTGCSSTDHKHRPRSHRMRAQKTPFVGNWSVLTVHQGPF